LASPTVPEPEAFVLAVPYVSRFAGRAGGDAVMRRVAQRTMAMTGRINEWDWEGGIAMVGLMHAYEATGDEEILSFVEGWVDARLAEGTPMTSDSWSDPPCDTDGWPAPGLRHPNHAAPAWAVLMLSAHRPKPGYRDVVRETVAFLEHRACRTDGLLAHVPGQLWDDTLAMAVPLMARYGAENDRPDLVDLAAREYLGHAERLQDQASGRWYHGWNSVTDDHMSAAQWARGNGWAAVAGAELLRNLHDEGGVRQRVRERLASQLAGLAEVQDESGLWHTVTDQPDFYLETSGSAAITAAMLQLGDVSLSLPELQLAARRGVRGAYAMVAPDGTVEGVSAGTGVAPTLDVYDMVPNDAIQPYGQGLFLIMASAAQ